MPEATKAKALYEQGLSLEEAGKQVGHSRKVVAAAFRLLGIPTRTPAESNRRRTQQPACVRDQRRAA